MASMNVSWRAPDEKFGVNATVRYNGEQKDFQFTPIGSNRVNLSSYTLVNLGADYRVNEKWQVYGRVENLLDKKAEEVFSFRGMGRAFYAGVGPQFPCAKLVSSLLLRPFGYRGEPQLQLHPSLT